MGDIRKTWSNIKGIIGCRNKRGVKEILYEGSVYCDIQKISHLFGDYFSLVPLSLRNNIPVTQNSLMEYLCNCSHHTMGFDLSNSDEINKIISSLANKMCKLDAVPVHIFKSFKDIFLPIIPQS